MKIRYPLVALVFVACTGDIGGKTGDTGGTAGQCADGRYDGPIAIVGAEVTCSNDTARFAMETDGLTGDGIVFSQETGNEATAQWSENNTLETFEFDVCGFFDKLEREITAASEPGDITPNERQQDVNSVFTCGGHYNDNNFMTFLFAANDQAGNQADCLGFGDDVSGINSYDRAGDEPLLNENDCQAGQEGI